MWTRHGLSALVLTGAAGCLIGCGKSDNSSPSEAKPAPNAAVAQMNISGPPPVVLGTDNIQAEIDKAAAGVKLVPLDLSSVGLPLTLEAPEGAKVERDPDELLTRRDSVDVEITAGDRFAIRIRLGKRPFDQKRQQLSGQKDLVSTKDLVLSTSMLLLDERCEFARHIVAGLQDYTIVNVDPLLGQQVNHSQADCLLMLKCAGTLTPRVPPPVEPVAALQQFHATLVKGADGQVANLTLDPRQTTDATLALVAKLPALERLILHRCPITDDGLAHLAGLTRLKELNLADCPITDAGLSSLSKLTNLEVLNLASSFGDSPQIKGHGLAALAGLTKLQVLVLDKNLVDDAGLSALQNVKSLRELYLEQTRVVGPGLASLGGLSNLKVLSLNETKIADAGLEGLQGVAGLEVLNLRGSLVCGDGLKHLHGLKNLHTLHLGNTPMTDAGLASLTGLSALQRLILEGTEVSDAGLTTLEGMKRLKRVALTGTKVTEAGADKLKKALQGVEVVLK
jgi:Leucine-rich repeat (LRR) protein